MQDIKDLDKDALGDYAFSGKDFQPVKLDLRKPLVALQEQVALLQEKTPEIQAVQSAKKATHIKNRETGMIFEYTDAIWNHLQDRVKCDKDGNDV
jgi:hypothetical protein